MIYVMIYKMKVKFIDHYFIVNPDDKRSVVCMANKEEIRYES